MDIDIRRDIINNFKGDNYKILKRAIDEAVKNQDEITLPSLGVFFEIVWENASDELKDTIITIIRNRAQKKTN